MDIAQGGDAAIQYFQFMNMKLADQNNDVLWDALYQYCRLDTYAMVELLAVVNSKAYDKDNI